MSQAEDFKFAYLAIDRAIGDVVEFIGFSKAEIESAGETQELNDKLKALDDASDRLQKLCWSIP